MGPEVVNRLSDAKRELLARALAGAAVVGRREDPVTPRPEGVTPPLTPEQRHVWLHASQAPDLPLYNEPCAIIRRGPLDPVALERSLNEIVRRHEIWRTSFEVVDGEVSQRVHRDVRLPLPVHDLSRLPPAEALEEARRLAAEDAHRPFDLARPPLLRALLVTLRPEEHRLYLILHHLILDGVSITSVVLPELLTLYDAYAAGLEPELPAPALQYGDFAIWRAREVESPQVQAQLGYWTRQLAGASELKLETDRPRPRTPTYGGGMEIFRLTVEQREGLKDLGRREGATLYAVLAAALTALLHRYSGQDDIMIGGLVDTRRRPELQKIIGYFLNGVVLRTRPTAELSFRELVVQASAAVVGALSASDIPFDAVVRAVQPRREAARHPLFQTMLVLEPPATFPDGWDVVQTEVTLDAAKFDLYFEFEERVDGLSCRLIYSTDLFDAGSIRRMVGHLRALLEAVVADPDQTLASLPLVGAEERQALAALGQGPTAEAPATSVNALVSAKARATPHATAAQMDDRRWSYRELDRRAGEIAHALSAMQLGPRPLVGVCMSRSLDMLAGLLAVGRIGGAYLPLDPSFPAERLAMIVDDARPAALLTASDAQQALAGAAAPRLLCDRIEPGGRSLAAPAAADPDSLAYVLYTSGSTGRPKGVEITQGALVNLLRSMQREPGFTAADCLLAVTTLSFDISMLELFLPLVAGGRVVIASREEAGDPERLARLVDTSGCTVLQATPATWRGLIDAGWTGRRDLKLLCGGEAMPRPLADALLARCGSLWNVYGPTETTIWSTIDQVEPGEARAPIGRPIDNTRTYVLDAHGQLAPTGVSGELYIGGLGLARGYRGRPDLTEERFLTLPGVPGERLYRTGDQARWRADGRLECLGRLDNQVKVRGFRIELEEVEAALARHPDVTAAAATIFQDESGEASLVGYLVPVGPAPAPADVRRFLQKTLPDYMVPSRFVSLASLPMTPNCKVDRKALPAPSGPVAAAAFVPPTRPGEAELAAIWQTVLGVSPISVEDNFFELGGHSLLVAKLFRQVEAELGHKLGMAAIFEAPDIRSMAALLAGSRAQPVTVNIQTHGSRPPLFWFDAGPTFRPLSAALGSEQPFLGVNVEQDEERELGPDFTIEQVAALLLKAVRTSQPRGPYFLGGYCNWGLVAHAAARQLLAEGEEVALLCMIHSPHLGRGVPSRLQMEISKARQHAGTVLRLGGRRATEYAVRRAGNALRRYRQWLINPKAAPPLTPFRAQIARVCRTYEPGRSTMPLVLFQPCDRPDLMEFAQEWSTTADGPFEEYEVPGDHLTMLTAPNVEHMGKLLSRSLKRAAAPLDEPLKALG
jgi:amino acid adenylation domain-containing protein